MVLDRVRGECFALQCTAGAKPNMLMCWGHWKRVPRAIQHEVWMSNEAGHPDYEASRLAARAAIAVKEGLGISNDDAGLLTRWGIDWTTGYPLKAGAT